MKLDTFFFLKEKYLISNLIICFRFPRASVRYYTVRALLYSACATIQCVRYYTEISMWVPPSYILFGGTVPPNNFTQKVMLQVIDNEIRELENPKPETNLPESNLKTEKMCSVSGS